MQKKSAAIQFGLILAALMACGTGCSFFQSDPAPSFAHPNQPIPAGGAANERQAAYYGDGPSSDHGKFKLEDLDPFNAKKTIKKYTGGGPNRDVARRLYQEGEAQFRQADAAKQSGADGRAQFLRAAATFEKAAERWPDSALEQDSLYMAGESYFFADRYPTANAKYEILIDKYPNTRHLDVIGVRRFALADFWVKADEVKPHGFFTPNVTDKTRPWRDSYGHGIRVFDKIRLDDPTGRLADDATMAAGNAYFRKGKFIDAGDMYEDLIRTFPNSEHQYMAHVLALRSKLASYQGSAYDEQPLMRAEKLLEQIRKQFPTEANKEENRQFLQRAYAEIRFRLAEREMKFAKYYDRRGEYGAARYYYDILASDYGETPFGAQANTRIAKIQHLPAVPPQRFAWLTTFFPEEEDVKPLIQTGDGGVIRR